MKLGGTVYDWTIVAGVVAAAVVIYLVYRQAAEVAETVGGVVRAPVRAAQAVGGAVVDAAKETGSVVGGAFSRPASVEEGEGASAPGYGP